MRTKACGESGLGQWKMFLTILPASRRRRARPVWAGAMKMSKMQRSNKESKKQPSLTPKEKKAAKRDKKNAGGSVPFSIKGS